MEQIKVLAFDTGGTVLDWHAGLTAAMTTWGAAHGIERDWHVLANEHRRRSLRRMTNTVDPGYNIDDVHRDVVGELFDENQLGGSTEERRAIAERWHQLDAWPDFPEALRRLRRQRICVSFTILSLSLIVDVSRRNGIDWDGVIPCEMLRVYKPLPDAYRRAAVFLAVEPHEILMVRATISISMRHVASAIAPPLCVGPMNGGPLVRPIPCQTLPPTSSSTALPNLPTTSA
jgi:2-haloacid dehalogenase